jgi:hypothetical protein
MKPDVLKSRELWVGIVFVLIASMTLYQSLGFRLGTLSRMGSGFFPTILSSILMLIGAASILQAILKDREPLPEFSVRPIVMITLSILVTGWTLLHFGIVLALPILLAISAFADRELKWGKWYLVYIVLLTAVAVLLFVGLLSLPIPLFGSVFK